MAATLPPGMIESVDMPLVERVDWSRLDANAHELAEQVARDFRAAGVQTGVVVATLVVIGLPEVFRDLAEYRMIAFGLGMVLIMLWRPSGLLAHREPTVRLHPGGVPPAETPAETPAAGAAR